MSGPYNQQVLPGQNVGRGGGPAAGHIGGQGAGQYGVVGGGQYGGLGAGQLGGAGAGQTSSHFSKQTATHTVAQIGGVGAGQYGGLGAGQLGGVVAGQLGGVGAGQNASHFSTQTATHAAGQFSTQPVGQAVTQTTAVHRTAETVQTQKQGASGRGDRHHRRRSGSSSSSRSSTRDYRITGATEGGAATGSSHQQYSSETAYAGATGEGSFGSAVSGQRRQGRHQKQVIRLPEQGQGPVRQVRRRLPTPEPDTLERV